MESCQAETSKTGKHNSITTKHGLRRLISGSAIPSLSISVENSVEDDDNVSSSLCSLFLSATCCALLLIIFAGAPLDYL